MGACMELSLCGSLQTPNTGLLFSFDGFPLFISLRQPCQLHCVSQGEPSKCKSDCTSLSSTEILSAAPMGLRSNADSLTGPRGALLMWLLPTFSASSLTLPIGQRPPVPRPNNSKSLIVSKKPCSFSHPGLCTFCSSHLACLLCTS